MTDLCARRQFSNCFCAPGTCELNLPISQSKAQPSMTDLPVTRQNLDRLYAVADASRALAYHVRRSVNVGPLSKSPAREAVLWRELRLALQALDNKVDGI